MREGGRGRGEFSDKGGGAGEFFAEAEEAFVGGGRREDVAGEN